MKLTALVVLGGCLLGACDSASAPKKPVPRRVAIPDTQPASLLVPDPPPPVLTKPSFTAGKTLKLEGRLGHAVLPSYADTETYVFAHVSADPGARAKSDVPLALAIVIDRSGSMKGKRLENAVSAARSAVGRLRDGDVVTVVSYNTTSEVLIQPTLIDAASRDRVTAAIKLVAKGDTCISCGIDAGVAALGDRPGMISRVLLLSDGLATAGVRDVAGFRQIADGVRKGGAAITTIGVDVDYDEKIMTALAADSNGRHYFVEDAKALPAIFDREMDSLTHTIANRAEIVVDLAPGVVAEEVLDRANASLGTQVVVPLGAFAAGEHKTVLVRVRVPRGTVGARTVASMHVRYDDLVTSAPIATDGELVAELTSDPGKLSPLDGIVAGRVASSDTAAVLTQANDAYAAGDYDAANGLIAAQRAKVDALRADAAATAPTALADEVDRNFAVQAEVLGGASGGFAPPPAAAPSADPGSATTVTGKATSEPKRSRPAKAQMRENAKDAFDLAQ